MGCFPDGESAVMLVGARLRIVSGILRTFARSPYLVVKVRKIPHGIRLRHLAGTRWGTRHYLDMSRLREAKS